MDEEEAMAEPLVRQQAIRIETFESEVEPMEFALLDSGHFNRFEPGALDAVIQSIREPADLWMTAADFRSFIDAQELAAQAYRDQERWTRMSILNTAASGRFSTDRTMQDYNAEIWQAEPINLDSK